MGHDDEGAELQNGVIRYLFREATRGCLGREAPVRRSTDGTMRKGLQCSEWGKPVPALEHKAL